LLTMNTTLDHDSGMVSDTRKVTKLEKHCMNGELTLAKETYCEMHEAKIEYQFNDLFLEVCNTVYADVLIWVGELIDRSLVSIEYCNTAFLRACKADNLFGATWICKEFGIKNLNQSHTIPLYAFQEARRNQLYAMEIWLREEFDLSDYTDCISGTGPTVLEYTLCRDGGGYRI
jgi:hypothetical protein